MEKKCIISKLNLIKNEISRVFSEETKGAGGGVNVGSVIDDIEKEIKEKEKTLEEEITNNKKLTTQLKQKEEYFENIYKNIESVIFVISVTGIESEFKFIGVNPAYEKATGFKEKNIIGKSSKEIFTKETAELFEENYKKCIKLKESIEYEENINVKGKNSWWHTKLIPIKDCYNNVTRIIGTTHDITPIKNAENEAKANEEFISTLMDTIPNPVFYKDGEKKYRGCNSAFENMVGIDREYIYGKKCDEVFPKDIANLTEYKDIELIKNHKKIEYEIRVKNKKNEIRDLRVNKAPYFNGKGELKGIVGVITDITDLKQMQEILKELSVNDELTGVYNKRGIREMGNKSFRDAKREEKVISIIMIDIDYFKKYNDYYGHQAGDRCLIAVADTIKESCKRPCDIVGRYGGEEFIVILPGTDCEGTVIVADRIRENIFNLNIPHEESETERYVSISAGIYAAIPEKDENIENFIEKADEKLYSAKKYGRNRVEK